MKHFEKERYSLAWFKLSECVARGQKERALGVYRLLYHSVGSDALATQLYADILLQFGDKDLATEKYLQAFELYKKESKNIEAIAMCEHLVLLDSKIEEKISFDLLDLYLNVGIYSKFFDLINDLIEKNRINYENFAIIKEFFCRLEANFSYEVSSLNQKIFFILLNDNSIPENFLINQLEGIVDFFILSEPDKDKTELNAQLLNDFLKKLKAKNEDLYIYILKYLE